MRSNVKWRFPCRYSEVKIKKRMIELIRFLNEIGGVTFPHLQQGRRLPVPSSKSFSVVYVFVGLVYNKIVYLSSFLSVPFVIKFRTRFEFRM